MDDPTIQTKRKQTNDLYKIDPNDFIGMKYEDVLIVKIEKSRTLIEELNNVHYLERDFATINTLVKALDFNTQQLNELDLSNIKDSDEIVSEILDKRIDTIPDCKGL